MLRALGEPIERIEDFVGLPHAVSSPLGYLMQNTGVDESVDCPLRRHVADVECPLHERIVDDRLRHAQSLLCWHVDAGTHRHQLQKPVVEARVVRDHHPAVQHLNQLRSDIVEHRRTGQPLRSALVNVNWPRIATWGH